MLHRIAALCTLALLFATAGCARYHMGHTMHPNVHTIAVPAVANDTNEPGLGSMAQSKIRAAFGTDGSLRVLDDEDAADSVLHARVVSYDYVSRGQSRNPSTDKDQEDVYISSIYAVRVTIEYDVTRPGKDKPLVSTRRATGEAEFTEMPDLEVARIDAWRLALADAADQVVYGVTEAW